MMLNRDYYFDKVKSLSIFEQYMKCKEELQEVFQEIHKKDNKNLVMETLDLIQAANNLLVKLEVEEGVEVNKIKKEWIEKMENYKKTKYKGE